MGKEFEKKTDGQLEETIWHPGLTHIAISLQGSGQVERLNHSPLSMLCTLKDNEKEDWKESLTRVNSLSEGLDTQDYLPTDQPTVENLQLQKKKTLAWGNHLTPTAVATTVRTE